MESIALGTPVLGTNIGGIPELIEDGKTGVLLPPATPRPWARRCAAWTWSRSDWRP